MSPLRGYKKRYLHAFPGIYIPGYNTPPLRG
jgi:hypothetical protein